MALPDKPCTIKTTVSDFSTSERSPVSCTCPTSGSTKAVRKTLAAGCAGAFIIESNAGATVHRCPATTLKARRAEDWLELCRRTVSCVALIGKAFNFAVISLTPYLTSDTEKTSEPMNTFDERRSTPSFLIIWLGSRAVQFDSV